MYAMHIKQYRTNAADVADVTDTKPVERVGWSPAVEQKNIKYTRVHHF